MNVADALTLLRVVLSPVFFLAFAAAQKLEQARPPLLVALVVMFAAIEVSDVLDGFTARATGSASDVGKILDPYADSISRLTYFVCFASVGIMPVWVLLLVIYRDITVSFARQLAVRAGTVMAARLTGKLKAWVYAFAGIAGMARLCARGHLIPGGETVILVNASQWLFFACGIIAAGSLIDYLIPVLGRRER